MGHLTLKKRKMSFSYKLETLSKHEKPITLFVAIQIFRLRYDCVLLNEQNL